MLQEVRNIWKVLKSAKSIIRYCSKNYLTNKVRTFPPILSILLKFDEVQRCFCCLLPATLPFPSVWHMLPQIFPVLRWALPVHYPRFGPFRLWVFFSFSPCSPMAWAISCSRLTIHFSASAMRVLRSCVADSEGTGSKVTTWIWASAKQAYHTGQSYPKEASNRTCWLSSLNFEKRFWRVQRFDCCDVHKKRQFSNEELWHHP